MFLRLLLICCFVRYTNGVLVGELNGPVNFTRPEGERLFYYYVPSTYDPSKEYPLIIYFHGYSGYWGQGVDFNQTVDAETNGYVIAFGQGTPSSSPPHYLGWNGGRCCLFNSSAVVDDVIYARTVVQLVSERVSIAKDRIYAMGWSNGGFLTERLACEASDLFVGAAADASGVIIGENCEDGLSLCDRLFENKHIDYIHFHGTNDEIVKWIGGGDSPVQYPSVLENLSRWIKRANCDQIQMETFNNKQNFTNILWPNCRQNTSVELMTVAYGTHFWWTQNHGNFSTSDYIMKSFTRNYLRRQNSIY